MIRQTDAKFLKTLRLHQWWQSLLNKNRF